MPPKRSWPDKKDELSTLAVPVFKPLTNTIISVWKWSPTMPWELVCVKVISHEQQEPIVQEKMALSLTFPLPALQSGAIASLAKWWPYAQLATRGGKWFIRPELASSHLLPSPMLAQCLRQAFLQQTEVSVNILSSWQLCSLTGCKLWRSMCPEISLSWWTFRICPTAALRSDVTARGMTQHRVCESVKVYLSQVDVDGVLQELRSLSGPLLNGQHTHSFHTGLQLNDSCILILRHNTERCCGHCL